MLTRVRIGVASSSNNIDINYGVDSHVGGYDLISVTGLEPPPTDVNYSRFALVPGGSYQSSSTDARNIVLRVGLKAHPGGASVLKMRRDLYHALPARELLTLRFWTNSVYEMRINGYLETIEHYMFSKEPELLISIVCPEPYFRSPSTVSHERLAPGTMTIMNDGDVPAGLDVTFRINSNFRNTLRLFNDTTGDSVQVLSNWQTDDRVRIHTREGSREVTLRSLTGGVRGHLLGSTDIVGDWPMLVRGENKIRAQSAGTGWSWDLTYLEYYGGY